MILLGNCKYKLKELDDNSVDSIVTDPPYELGFMGKKWDSSGIAYDVDMWKECLRVLKPGGHLLSFGGTRTYHRMVAAIEDAGFEIRDMIEWIYGSGFPKSMNISKSIDKKFGAEREIIGVKAGHEEFVNRQTKGHIDFKGATEGFDRPWMHDDVKRELYHMKTAPSTPEAKQWDGWGTALKPAHEPICVAKKPLSEATIVDNILKWGTGGINIDDSRISLDEENDKSQLRTINRSQKTNDSGWGMNSNGSDVYPVVRPEGRFPANIMLDEEAGRMLDEQSGHLKSGFMKSGTPRLMSDNPNKNTYGNWKPDTVENDTYGDSGGASRFFYCPKASKTDRDEGLEDFENKYYAAGNQAKAELKRGNIEYNANKGKGADERHNFNQVGVSKNDHPTVKPTELMLYLIRLVTPEGGITLDPFMGSGSSGKAAARGGFSFIGIEKEHEYVEISKARIKYEKENPYDERTGKRTKINKNSNKFW